MAQSYDLLAIDLGAESGRAILGTFDGEKLAVSELHRFANTPVRLPDGLHWDALHLWDEIKNGLAQAIRKQRKAPESLGIDTWGVDFGLLDKHGAMLSNPYHYRDSRTDGMLDEAFRHMRREQMFELTGIQFMQINSLYQLLAMAVSQSPVLDVAETFLTIPDLFNFWLTGQVACEFTIATTTQCYDPRLHAWAEPLLLAMGIPRRIFPRVIPPGTILGPLSQAVRAETGAANLCVIAPACHDTGSAVAAVPAQGQDFAWISSGTWSIMGIETREPIINAKSLASNFTNEGGVNGTFRYSKNIGGLWLVQECRRAWAAQGENFSYGELTEMATQADPLVSLVDPDHLEFLQPGNMPARIRGFCERTGQPVPASKGAVVRCALESVALKYRWVLEHLEEMVGHRLEPIHIIGGGTQNRLLNQFAADATGRVVTAGPIEATAIGNLCVQAIALGRLGSLDQARTVVRQSFVPEVFEPTNTAAWSGDAYSRLLSLMAEPELLPDQEKSR